MPVNRHTRSSRVHVRTCAWNPVHGVFPPQAGCQAGPSRTGLRTRITLSLWKTAARFNGLLRYRSDRKPVETGYRCLTILLSAVEPAVKRRANEPFGKGR